MLLERPAPVETAPLRVGELERPAPGAGQLLVRVHCCGVCHTDLHQVEGELPMHLQPVVPGHQIVGRVEATGDGVSGFAVGDRVGMAWLHETCGQCRYCKRGDENLCESARFTGYDVHGGYAEYTLVDHRFAYALPGTLDDEQTAPLLCAGIIGYRSLRLSNVQPGGRLGLYGFGASAHVTIQIAVHQKMQVYVFSRTEAHRDLARRLGAVWCGQAEAQPPEKLDGSIIFAPAGGIVPHAMEHLDRGGTCALAGIYMSEIPPLDYERHLYQERQLRSVTASTRRDGQEFLDTAARVPVETTVTAYPLEKSNEVLQRLKDGGIDGAAVLRIASE